MSMNPVIPDCLMRMRETASRETFGKRIKALQYRYERDGHKLGGIHVLGGNCRLNPLLIFGDKA